jgi:hypothetical protein
MQIPVALSAAGQAIPWNRSRLERRTPAPSRNLDDPIRLVDLEREIEEVEAHEDTAILLTLSHVR